MLHFDLYTLYFIEKNADLDSKSQIDEMFVILTACVKKAVKLSEQNLGVTEILNKIEAARRKIESIVSTFSESIAKQKDITNFKAQTSLPNLKSPKLECISVSDSTESLDVIQKRAIKNIGSLSNMGPNIYSKKPFEFTLAWMTDEKTRVSNHNGSLLIIATINSLFFQKAAELAKPEDSVLLDITEMKAIDSIVVQYRSILDSWLSTSQSKELVTSIQRSNEMIIVWTACCLIHNQNVRDIPILNAYSMPIKYKDLKYLVVDDREAYDATIAIASYILRHERGSPVFSLKDKQGTYHFSHEFSSQDSSIKLRWENEKAETKCRLDLHQAQVNQKKNLAASLRKVLVDLESDVIYKIQELSSAKAELYSKPHPKKCYKFNEYDWWFEKRNEHLQAKEKHNRCLNDFDLATNKLNTQKEDIKSTIKAPPFIISPLPENEKKALIVLFFLLMPNKLNIYARLCIESQTMLLPRGWPLIHQTNDYKVRYENYRKTLNESIPSTSWSSHYNNHKGKESNTCSDGHLIVSPINFEIPKQFGPSTVDNISSSSQCIWFPDNFSNDISNDPRINPFLANLEWTKVFYTECVSKENTKLQWIVDSPDDVTSSSTKGNFVFANQNLIPRTFNKDSFLALGGLRTFPFQQIRKLICAIRERILPLENEIVRSTFQHIMFQIGSLSNDEIPKALWRFDLDELDGYQALHNELKSLAEYLKQTPRDHKSILILSELAAYISQFYPPSRALSREYCSIARNWATDIRNQMEAVDISPELRLSLRAKECLMFAYALLCHAFGEFTIEDARTVCELIALFHNGMVYAHDSDLRNELNHLLIAINNMMARRVKDVLRFAENNNNLDTILTPAVRKLLQLAPEHIQWSPLIIPNTSYRTDSFVAEAEGHSYAFNIMTGCVLLDGVPPGRLSADIRNHPLYKKCFGLRDFEVFPSNNILETAMAIDSVYFYKFGIFNEHLLVQEFNKETGVTLELIDFKTRATWWNDLPVFIRDMNSHWFCESQNVLLFRPFQYNKRSVDCIANLGFSDKGLCSQVESHDRNLDISKLIEKGINDFNHFVIRDECQVTRALAHYEDKIFIHTLQSPLGDCSIWRLSRFDLNFSLKLSDQENLPNSLEYRGYRLASKQTLTDTMPFFKQYIVLERKNKQDFSTPEFKLLIQNGLVNVTRNDGMINICRQDKCDEKFTSFIYHQKKRSWDFSSSTIAGRIQFATILAASSTMLPDQRLKMTGTEAAITLLRQCWVNRPLDEQETEKLKNLVRFSNCEPALNILSNQLLFDSKTLSFLHGYEETYCIDDDEKSRDCATKYKEIIHYEMNICRRGLTSIEASRSLLRQPIPITREFNNESKLIQNLKPCPVSKDYVTEIENKLQRMIKQFVVSEQSRERFPLEINEESLVFKAMMDELRISWDEYQSTPQLELENESSLLEIFQTIGKQVKLKRESMETYLTEVSQLFTKQDMSRNILLVLANHLPILCFSDLMAISFNDSVLETINPCLGKKARSSFQQADLIFLELCVLEDKLERLKSFTGNKNALIQEILSNRIWSIREHPRWLVFEVEGHLQIRNEQYLIAKHLIDNPRSICQLNMGRGKTRVILPLLILYFASKRITPRIHILSALLTETLEYLHLNLTASVLNVHILQQPFQRQNNLSTSRLVKMHEAVSNDLCCLVVAPEYRLSLQLKALELEHGNENELSNHLKNQLANKDFINIFDESDALLNHRYQLIYAVGSVAALEQLNSRAIVGQSLLRILNYNEEIRSFLELNDLLIIEEIQSNCQYRCFRLPEVTMETTSLRKELKLLLLTELIKEPPYELQWIKVWTAKSKNDMERVIELATDPSVNTVKVIKEDELQETVHWEHLLSLRGNLAFGLLEYAIEQRYRVHYGIDVSRKPKRLAVPFTAADVPSLRSEFSHPDVSIHLTCLAYYHKGLTKDQLNEALKQLLNLGQPAQEKHYGQWLEPIKSELNPEELKMIDDVKKIDLSNSLQNELLFNKFKLSMEAINYWLNNRVFPTDTAQYPQRIIATSWNLADEESIGFSGTNDNHRLLPKQVLQNEPNVPALLGTNGKMLDFLLRYTRSFHIVNGTVKSQNKIDLIDFALRNKCQALIDTGSLLAGISNKEAAMYIIKSTEFDVSMTGVYYFDTTVGGWMVLDRRTNRVIRQSESHIRERDAFVIFDDARCRGADMKLKEDAVAVLTLGPKITKDKLMQGAGRMRLLGTQTLQIVTTQEINNLIHQRIHLSKSHEIGIEDVLKWVILNTETSTLSGLSQWSKQGVFYCESIADHSKSFADENWSLNALYSEGQKPIKLSEAIPKKLLVGASEEILEIQQGIFDQLERFGNEREVMVSDRDEKCEREMQLEEEEEEEQERETQQEVPKNEPIWDYTSVLSAETPADLSNYVKIITLGKGIESMQNSQNGLIKVDWNQKIYGTINFFTTIDGLTPVGTNQLSIQNDCMRRIDTFLRFKDDSILLISDQESDSILSLLWSNPSTVQLFNLCMVRDTLNNSKPYLSVGSKNNNSINEVQLVTLQLFAGETKYSTSERKEILKKLVMNKQARYLIWLLVVD